MFTERGGDALLADALEDVPALDVSNGTSKAWQLPDGKKVTYNVALAHTVNELNGQQSGGLFPRVNGDDIRRRLDLVNHGLRDRRLIASNATAEHRRDLRVAFLRYGRPPSGAASPSPDSHALRVGASFPSTTNPPSTARLRSSRPTGSTRTGTGSAAKGMWRGTSHWALSTAGRFGML
ncbi:hypothetical protein JCM8547_003752 [Rhodosporidiobolus lusitaniae]